MNPWKENHSRLPSLWAASSEVLIGVDDFRPRGSGWRLQKVSRRRLQQRSRALINQKNSNGPLRTASMGDYARLREDFVSEDEPVSRDAIQTSIAPPSRRCGPTVPDAAALAEGPKERIPEKCIYFQRNFA
jgi:hypothetical protein